MTLTLKVLKKQLIVTIFNLYVDIKQRVGNQRLWSEKQTQFCESN